MKGHKGAINSIAIHNSGRLALTIARDKHLKMWDLVQGRYSYSEKLKAEADIVKFVPNGQEYALACGKEIVVKNTSGKNENLFKMSHPRNVNAFTTWMSGENTIFMSGTENGQISIWDTRSQQDKSKPSQIIPSAHLMRIKGLALIHNPTIDEDIRYFTSCDSGGTVKLWDLRNISSNLSSNKKEARITCFCYNYNICQPSGGLIPQKDEHVLDEIESDLKWEDTVEKQVELWNLQEAGKIAKERKKQKKLERKNRNQSNVKNQQQLQESQQDFQLQQPQKNQNKNNNKQEDVVDKYQQNLQGGKKLDELQKDVDQLRKKKRKVQTQVESDLQVNGNGLDTVQKVEIGNEDRTQQDEEYISSQKRKNQQLQKVQKKRKVQ
eukprot:TRINITY_DN31505_c0_g1_i1.p1 TRINITY_DN31505_c0_g1~~TRINITY_DN31505_c0_g1_i1.p1  ORF type:complete len:411 (-),score=61.01 TRINITY_DN31505_c0_g1_i1:295-1434(-)